MGSEEERLRNKQNSLAELQRLLAELKEQRKECSGVIHEIQKALSEDRLKDISPKQEGLKVDADEMPRNTKGMDYSNRVSNIQKAFDVYRNAHATHMQWSP